jgi:hypothetical protein
LTCSGNTQTADADRADAIRIDERDGAKEVDGW